MNKNIFTILIFGVVLTAILSIPANYSLAILLTLRTPQLISSSIPTPIIDIFWYIVVLMWIAFWLIIGIKIGKSRLVIVGSIIGIFVSLLFPWMAINLIGILSAYSLPSYLGEASLFDKIFTLLAVKYGGFLGKILFRFLGAASFLIVGIILSFIHKKYQASRLNETQSLKLSVLTTIFGMSSGGLMINLMRQFFIPVWIISGISLFIIIWQHQSRSPHQ